MTPPDPLPVTLLTGFLGAGKTTLVNRVLREHTRERFAVVVNEFGDVGVDGELVVGAGERLVQLANGCVCCTVAGDLARALTELLDARARRLFGRRDFDRVLIETSGLAAPGPVAQTLAAVPRLAAELRLDAVVTLAHAVNLPRQLDEFAEAAEQLAYADVVLLNHADRADAAQLVAARTRIAALNPLARVVETSFSAAPLDALLDVRTTSDAGWDLARGASLAHRHAGDVSAVALESRAPLAFDALKMWLQFLARRRGHELYRVKGVLRCAERAERVVVQGMYEWLELGPSAEPAPAVSTLVLIGKHLDRAELERGWRACGGDAPQALRE